ncbi:MAG: hypothetical protein QW099_05680 [Candidatus Bathyarchaeia archaeon]
MATSVLKRYIPLHGSLMCFPNIRLKARLIILLPTLDIASASYACCPLKLKSSTGEIYFMVL